MSICRCVWLHVCRLRRCASFDLNSYPTAYYRVCCSYSTDCSRLRNLNFSRLQTPRALSFQLWHTVTFKWNPCLSMTARVNRGIEEPNDLNLTFVLFVKNWSGGSFSQEISSQEIGSSWNISDGAEIWAMHYCVCLCCVYLCKTNLLKIACYKYRIDFT